MKLCIEICAMPIKIKLEERKKSEEYNCRIRKESERLKGKKNYPYLGILKADSFK